MLEYVRALRNKGIFNNWASQLIIYVQQEKPGIPQVSSETIQNDFENLHDLSKCWHIIREDLIDFEERMEFLLDLWEKYYDAHARQALTVSTKDSLSFIMSRIRVWRRWTSNYTTRTNIRINLFFNLASQNDNRTNLDIASSSKTIAEETRQDSSSMITIAAVTMVFLPATFVSVSFVVVTSFRDA